jgi:hypothetical protein
MVKLLFQLDVWIATCMLGPDIIMVWHGSNYPYLSQKFTPSFAKLFFPMYVLLVEVR